MSSIKTLIPKIVLLGASNVGKSTLAWHYTQKRFIRTDNTIGASFFTAPVDTVYTSLKWGTCQFKLQLWDTAGQERYHSLAPMYYRNAHVIVLVYDVTSGETTKKVKEYFRELVRRDDVYDRQPLLVFIGNKIDLCDGTPMKKHPVFKDMQMFMQQQQEWHHPEWPMFHVALSAKTGQNIEETFERIMQSLLSNDTHMTQLLNLPSNMNTSHIILQDDDDIDDEHRARKTSCPTSCVLL